MKEKTEFEEYCLLNNIVDIKQSNIADITSKSIIYKHKNRYENCLMQNVDYSYISCYDEYCNNGQKQVIKLLSQGRYKIAAVLDLHNYTQATAYKMLNLFIDMHTTKGDTCLKIIHGKGHNSYQNVAVLRILVRRFLENHHRLIAYARAPQNQGGDGATLVKLKQEKSR